MAQRPITSQMSQPSTAAQTSQQPTSTQMSQTSTNSQAPLPNFILQGVTVKVKSARDTHNFLCEIFAQPNTFINWEPAAQKGRLPQLTKDGMHTEFYMSNTAIRFSTSTSNNPVGWNRITFCAQVQDVIHIKKVLDGRKWEYEHGGESTPEHPRWIRFPDLDGNTWLVSELKRT